MTFNQWIDVVKVMRADWPHAELPEVSIRKWHADLEDLDGRQVLAAVETLYRDGREFPPSGAMIRTRVLELAEAASADWTKGYSLAAALAPGLSWLTYPEKTMAWLRERDEVAAETVRRYGVETWGMRLERDEGTSRAQFRDIYIAAARTRQRERTYLGIDPAGLAGLEQGGKPKRLGDVVKKLGMGTT